MEEKERYEINDNDCIIDNEKDVAICDVCDVSESPEIVVDLLNKQDKHIKGLENSNQKLQDYYWGRINKLDELYNKDLEERLEENQQLKEENGYIIFSDGYDKDGNEIHKQDFVTYKDKCKELVEENKQLKKQISNMEETHKRIMSGEYIPANVAEKSLKLSEQSQKQLAIEKLKGLRDKICDIGYDEDYNTDYFEVMKEIDDQIKELKEGKPTIKCSLCGREMVKLADGVNYCCNYCHIQTLLNVPDIGEE